jgi:hypothetical protein
MRLRKVARWAKEYGRFLAENLRESLPFFVIAALVGMQIGWLAAEATADEHLVYVSPAIDGYYGAEARILKRLADGDDIAVSIYGPGEPMDLGAAPGKILIALAPNAATTRGNAWVPQAVLDDKLRRVSGVVSTPVDRAVRMIDEIHTWQAQNPKPKPPPPPPAPPEPVNWTPWLIGTPIALIVGLLTYLRIRKVRLVNRLARAADEAQAAADRQWQESER